MTRTRTPRDREQAPPQWEPEPLSLPLYVPERRPAPASEEVQERAPRVIVIDLT